MRALKAVQLVARFVIADSAGCEGFALVRDPVARFVTYYWHSDTEGAPHYSHPVAFASLSAAFADYVKRCAGEYRGPKAVQHEH